MLPTTVVVLNCIIMGMYWAAVHRPCTGLLFKTVMVIGEGQTGDLIRLAQGMNIPSLYGIQDL